MTENRTKLQEAEGKFTVSKEQAGQRLDRFLADCLPEMSRSYLQKLVREGQILLEGRPVKSGAKLTEGARVTVTLPEPQETEILPENIPLDVLYEDRDVILINKPKGMVVHPAVGHTSGTLVNGLLYHCKGDLSGINGVLRPGIVHRIDKDTTGVLIVCKNDQAHRNLAEQLKEHSITRRYRAVVCGNLKEDEGTIDAPMRTPSGRAETNGCRAGWRKKCSDALPCTGTLRFLHLYRMSAGNRTDASDTRTHGEYRSSASRRRGIWQRKIAVSSGGTTLHAMVLGFVHPSTGEYMEFEAPLPEYFEKLLERLRRDMR